MQVALGRGDGTFPITTVVQLPDIPNQVELADVNRDGRLDVVLLLDGFKRGAQPSDTHVWLGDGAGGLAATSWTTVFISEFGVNFTIADVNHDGYLDIVGSECHQMAVALGRATGFAAPVYTTVSTDDDGANSVHVSRQRLLWRLERRRQPRCGIRIPERHVRERRRDVRIRSAGSPTATIHLDSA